MEVVAVELVEEMEENEVVEEVVGLADVEVVHVGCVWEKEEKGNPSQFSE